MAEAPGENAVISGECRLETVPSPDGALLKGLRLELDLRLAPAGADGKGGTLAVLRVERARLGVPVSGVTPHQAWAVAAGVFSVALSIVLWFALDPQRGEVSPVSPAMTELPEPPPVTTPPPAPLQAIPPTRIDAIPASEPPLPFAVTPISPSVGLVRAPDPPVTRSQPSATSGRPRPPAPKAGLASPAPRTVAAVVVAGAASASPEPQRPVDVLDLFADTK